MNKQRSVFIVGANSMVGRHVVDFFEMNGWQVFAAVTSRSRSDHAFPTSVTVVELNLQRSRSIQKAVKKILKYTDTIDVLINSAGIVYSGPLEAFSKKQVQKQMDINYFGVVETIQAVIPIMREKRRGVIVNVSSICGLVSFPMLSIYHASKWALEGLSESLYYELNYFGIKVKLIEPGGIKQEGEAAKVSFPENTIVDYNELMDKVHNAEWFPSFTSARKVGEEVYLAALDTSNKLRYILGKETFSYVNERSNYSNDESYLTKMKQRIIT